MQEGMSAQHPSPGGPIPRGANREAVIEAPPGQRPGALRLPAALASGVLVALWALSLVQPPAPAAPGLDQSWRIGLTLATLEHLQYGRDIVFTFGPLGFVLQGVPEPALARAAALVALGLAAIAGLGAWFVVVGRASVLQKVAFGLGLLALGSVYSVDYSILAGVLALLVRAARFPRLAALVGVCIGAVALFGALSKYTLAADVLAAAGAVWTVDLLRGPARRRRAALLAASIAFGGTALGLAAAFGLRADALAAYLRGASEISSGYSAAMASSGPPLAVGVALAVAAVTLALAAAVYRERQPTALALAAVTLFLTWKHGFVRQDAHVLAYFATAAVLAPLLGTLARSRVASRLAAAASAIALGAFGWIVVLTLGFLPALFEPARIARGADFVLHARATEAQLAALSDAALAPDRLAPAVLRRIGASTVDVLPVETAVVKANGLRWAPLPVFQAYSAYTPALDRLNRDALIARGASEVLYDYVSIDERYPFGDMPATTRELLCRYRPVTALAPATFSARFVLLLRAADARCAVSSAGIDLRAAMNAPIRVPRAGSPDTFVVASFALRPTLLTRLATALWRGPHASLRVRYADGSVKDWRLVTATAPDGMVVSPAPFDHAEFVRFLAGEPVREVREVTLLARPGAYVLDSVTFTREHRLGSRTAR
jgi:hypothetical protein